ncbi:hypothetical protein [Kribbella pratensis]|uniref:hypothetical protein n=1 Tax=Kribbella pratensis TaxID=2512112 RepID=UPI001065A2DA|nr:hypothetical protein [Kribbella pratensis]
MGATSPSAFADPRPGASNQFIFDKLVIAAVKEETIVAVAELREPITTPVHEDLRSCTEANATNLGHLSDGEIRK